jgi:hypothetical protein
MFIGLGGRGGQVPLVWLTHSLVTRMPSMLQISSKFWKAQISESLQKFVIWLLVVVGWDGLDVGVLVLVLVVVMGAAVGVMIQVMVEGVGGDFLLPLLAGQKEVEAVDMTLRHVRGTEACLLIIIFINCLPLISSYELIDWSLVPLKTVLPFYHGTTITSACQFLCVVCEV